MIRIPCTGKVVGSGLNVWQFFASVISCWLCLISFSAAAHAAPSFCDLPAQLNDRYDVSWTLNISNPRQAAFSLDVEIPLTGQGGYRLTLSSRQAKWESLSRPAAFAAVTVPVDLKKKDTALWTLKRRPQIIALLYNHRLVFSAPAPTTDNAIIRLSRKPSGVLLCEMEYHPIDAPYFGDDFMRVNALERLLAGLDSWQEDDKWQDVNRGQWKLSPIILYIYLAVVFSCNSVLGENSIGYTIKNLGARNVIGTLESVPTAVAKDISIQFFPLWTKGKWADVNHDEYDLEGVWVCPTLSVAASEAERIIRNRYKLMDSVELRNLLGFNFHLFWITDEEPAIGVL